MEQVKAAVGHDQFFAGGTNLLPPRRQIGPRDDFVTEMHAPILPAPRRLATILNGGENHRPVG
jgi:hypothetical protein